MCVCVFFCLKKERNRNGNFCDCKKSERARRQVHEEKGFVF